MKKYYLLFGFEAVTIFMDEDIEAVIRHINEDGIGYAIATFEASKDPNPADILNTLEKHGKFAFLTEEEYNKLKNEIE